MSRKALVRFDVDSQVAFALPTGRLFVPHVQVATRTANVYELVSDAIRRRVPLLGSVDSHAWDSSEFAENGGPFPAHAVKGTSDWLKLPGTLPRDFRFVPMTTSPYLIAGGLVTGERSRLLTMDELVVEATQLAVGLYFEKEIYDFSANPFAIPLLTRIVEHLRHEAGERPLVQVFGWCTGGYCVDAACLALLQLDVDVQIVLDATVPIGGDVGEAQTRSDMEAAGVVVVTTEEALAA